MVIDSSGTTCPAAPPVGYEDFISSYPPIAFTGSLEGCLYIKVDAFKDNGSSLYRGHITL